MRIYVRPRRVFGLPLVPRRRQLCLALEVQQPVAWKSGDGAADRAALGLSWFVVGAGCSRSCGNIRMVRLGSRAGAATKRLMLSAIWAVPRLERLFRGTLGRIVSSVSNGIVGTPDCAAESIRSGVFIGVS